MRRKTPIADQLYHRLFPRASATDPSSFAGHLQRNLVPEVRIEVATFYGDLNSVEARYPGLDYNYPPHRMRLSRFKHHRRLFDAFDALGLTDGEVRDFCCWEGTRWARERYEKDAGVKVHDTTGDEIGPYVDRRQLREASRRSDITRRTEISVIVEEAAIAAAQSAAEADHDKAMTGEEEEDLETEDDCEDDVEDDTESGQDTPLQQMSFPAALRPMSDVARLDMEQRILAAQQQGRSLSPEMEQFLKDERERANMAAPAASRTTRAAA